ncbi:MAG: zinc-dependent alcohol dehydrogenase family protein [Ardenticatenaceae bacterium]
MKAAVYEQFAQPLTIQEVADPMGYDDGVVIRVMANGICRSDWHGWMGHDSDIKLPHVPGHELAGVVVEVGKDVRLIRRGDRVTVPFAVGCGRCAQCVSGHQHICDDYFQPGFTAWGSFAQYVAIRYADVNLVRLPDEIGFVEAASLGCRFITSFRAVVTQGRVEGGEWVVIHGCGGVGLSAIMIANALGANVIGVDIKADKLAFAQSIGATHVLNAQEEEHLIEAIHDFTGGGAHVSIDALGSMITCRNSILSLRKRGKHVQVGLMLADERDALIPMDQVIAKELEILGSHGMQAHQYGPMLQMITHGKLQPKKLIGKTVTLEESLAELQSMGQFRGVGVTVINQF